MKREYIFFGLIILLLSVIAFFLGANYGKNSPISGNVVYDNLSLERIELLEENLNNLQRDRFSQR